MPLRAIIFDLDDTLYDCSYTLTADAQKRAIEAMTAQGLRATIEEATLAIPALRAGQQGKVNIVEDFPNGLWVKLRNKLIRFF